MLPTVKQLNAMVLRPFRTSVDLETVALLLALLMVAAGAWHLVLERIEL
jgi:hypothetical protein